MRVLNLYAGIGGNRKLWPEGVEVTAVEWAMDIAQLYADFYPQDTTVCEDAHAYLLKNYQDFDFIWSSPPCQSHSKMIRGGKNRTPRYPDMRLYEEIIFLKHNFNGKWVVENVVPYYDILVPAEKRGRHLFWSNFYIPEFNSPQQPNNFINMANIAGKKALMGWLDIHFDKNIYYDGNHCPAQILRNAVHPKVGKIIYEAAINSGPMREIAT